MMLERSSFTNRLLCVNVEGDLKVFCVSEFDFRGGWGETGATYIWARFFILNELDCDFLIVYKDRGCTGP